MDIVGTDFPSNLALLQKAEEGEGMSGGDVLSHVCLQMLDHLSSLRPRSNFKLYSLKLHLFPTAIPWKLSLLTFLQQYGIRCITLIAGVAAQFPTLLQSFLRNKFPS